MENITLNSWTHPKTNEVRLYVDSKCVSYSEKVFFVKERKDDFDCKYQSEGYHSRDKEAMTVGDVYDAISAKAGKDIFEMKWSDLLALAK